MFHLCHYLLLFLIIINLFLVFQFTVCLGTTGLNNLLFRLYKYKNFAGSVYKNAFLFYIISKKGKTLRAHLNCCQFFLDKLQLQNNVNVFK